MEELLIELNKLIMWRIPAGPNRRPFEALLVRLQKAVADEKANKPQYPDKETGHPEVRGKRGPRMEG